ncbi:MAG: hypothetical protein R3Y22_04930, partial [Bacteroidales bacterium]
SDRGERKFEPREERGFERKFDRGSDRGERKFEPREPREGGERRVRENTGPKHGVEIADKVVRFRQPTLDATSEKTIIRGRRNGWKRNNIDNDNNNNTNKDS